MNELESNKEVAVKRGHSEHYLNVAGVTEYCTNPLDAWPIIEKYKIDLTHEDGNCYASVSGENELVITDDKSALKAAMLCFLEMEINDDK